MKVHYERLEYKDGFFLRKEKARRLITKGNLSSVEDITQFQERIFDATDLLVESFQEYQLPPKVDGKVKMSLERFLMQDKKRSFLRKRRIDMGELGFPRFHIITDLGCSRCHFSPETTWRYELKEELNIYAYGNLAISLVKKNLEAIQRFFFSKRVTINELESCFDYEPLYEATLHLPFELYKKVHYEGRKLHMDTAAPSAASRTSPAPLSSSSPQGTSLES